MTEQHEDRGQAVIGAAALAGYIFGDEAKARCIYALSRAEFGLIDLGGRVMGYTKWIDRALTERAKAGRKRRRRQRLPEPPHAPGPLRSYQPDPARAPDVAPIDEIEREPDLAAVPPLT